VERFELLATTKKNAKRFFAFFPYVCFSFYLFRCFDKNRFILEQRKK